MMLKLNVTTQTTLLPEKHMHPEDAEKSNPDSKSVDPKDKRDGEAPLNPAGEENSTLAEVPEDSVPTKVDGQLKQAYVFRNLLLVASFILVAGTAIFNLDLLPSVLLGCGVIGFNYFWTMQFVRNYYKSKNYKHLIYCFLSRNSGFQ